MALGGVATGSMKAKEALRVQGIITYRGCKLIDWDCMRTQKEKHTFPVRAAFMITHCYKCYNANTHFVSWEYGNWVCAFVTMEARIGRKSVAVATLLAHSVKVAIRRQRTMAMAQGGMELSGVIWAPSQRDRPDSWQHTHTHTPGHVSLKKTKWQHVISGVKVYHPFLVSGFMVVW